MTYDLTPRRERYMTPSERLLRKLIEKGLPSEYWAPAARLVAELDRTAEERRTAEGEISLISIATKAPPAR